MANSLKLTYSLFVVLIINSCTVSQKTATIDKDKPKNKGNKNIQANENPDIGQYITAVNEKITGNYESAARLFEDYLVKYPKSADAYYNLAGVYDAQ